MRLPWSSQYASVSDSDVSRDGDEKDSFLEGGVPSIRKHAKTAGRGGLFMILWNDLQLRHLGSLTHTFLDIALA